MSNSEHPAHPARLTPGYLEVIAIVMLIAGMALYGYDRFFAQKIKVVDMSSFFRQQKALMAAGEISEADFRANLNRLDDFVSRDAGQNTNQIYILKEVVLKNGDELILR